MKSLESKPSGSHSENQYFCCRACAAFLLLVLSVLIVYSNSFDCSWHFDDFPNIVWNKRLHLQDLYPNSILGTFYEPALSETNEKGKLYRPVAGLTFGINWYFGQDDVFGYHVVNVLIHCLSALMLWAAMHHLLSRSPRLKGRYGGKECEIALLAALLWAIHPIQTQAVTYIVQRMASLSAMFCIFSIYAYLKMRTASNRWAFSTWLGICAIGFLLALGSKQNAAILPVLLLLIEIAFFQANETLAFKKRGIWMVVGIMALALIGAVLLFTKGRLISIVTGYDGRPFGLWERLLTEFRVVSLYLSQIIYPTASRFSFVHDIVISRSLLSPWTTLPAIGFITALIAGAILKFRRMPLLAFSMLFFFISHSIESTILPLELVFEHRNYLPSFFLFLPMAAWIVGCFHNTDERYALIRKVLFGAGSVIVAAVGMATYTRNFAWENEKTFWEDAIIKAPNVARSYHNLANDYYEKNGMPGKALMLYKMALEKEDLVPRHRAYTYNNIGRIYQKNQNFLEAIRNYDLALALFPAYSEAIFNSALAHTAIGRMDAALQLIDKLLALDASRLDARTLKGFILMKSGRDGATDLFKRNLQNAPYHPGNLLNYGVSLGKTGRYDLAGVFLEKAYTMGDGGIVAQFFLIENALMSGNDMELKRQMARLMRSYDVHRILTALRRVKDDSLSPPIKYEMVLDAIKKELQAIIPADVG